MHFILFLLTLALSVIASQSTLPNPPTISTFIDANGTTSTSEDLEWHVHKQPAKINPRFFKSGGFLDKCKDVRYYLSKADDNDSNKHGVRQGYKSSPWLVAKCPDKNGKYLCTWLELGKCLLNVDGDLQRGPK
jgi:ATP-binding cassette subfamily B (MDR/TAP) protein 1